MFHNQMLATAESFPRYRPQLLNREELTRCCFHESLDNERESEPRAETGDDADHDGFGNELWCRCGRNNGSALGPGTSMTNVEIRPLKIMFHIR